MWVWVGVKVGMKEWVWVGMKVGMRECECGYG